MEKLKYHYIIQKIIDYIKDDNIKLKLFLYSKKIQKELGIELFDYQKKYFDIIGINPISKYLCYCSLNNLGNLFSKPLKLEDEFRKLFGINWLFHLDYLCTDTDFVFCDTYTLQKDLVKYKIDIKKYLIKYFEKYSKEFEKIKELKAKNVKLIKIDTNQPFFDLIYKCGIFEEFFFIPIDIKSIEKYNLKDYYTSVFNKLNEINSNYSSISFSFQDDTDVKYLKDFKVHFNQIKNLEFKQNYKEKNQPNLNF